MSYEVWQLFDVIARHNHSLSSCFFQCNSTLNAEFSRSETLVWFGGDLPLQEDGWLVYHIMIYLQFKKGGCLYLILHKYCCSRQTRHTSLLVQAQMYKHINQTRVDDAQRNKGLSSSFLSRIKWHKSPHGGGTRWLSSIVLIICYHQAKAQMRCSWQ